jgi:hypothetical protein
MDSWLADWRANDKWRTEGALTVGGGRSRLAPIAAVEYLEAARPLARNDQLGVPVTKLYLSNGPASGVNLPQDDGCTSLNAPRRSVQT